jgi:hypothetical protein
MGEQERAGGRVVKLATIVALDDLHGGAKLSTHIGKEVRNSNKSVGFKTKRKSPSIMREIIKNHEIIFVTGHANNGRGPKITMYQIESVDSTRTRRPKRNANMTP